MTSEPRKIGDMKYGLTGGRPQLTIVPRAGLVATTRALEYGAAFYARGNYHGPSPENVSPAQRVLGYLDATLRHVYAVADAVNHALGTGGDVAAAIGARDMVAIGKPPSGLPDLAHAAASLMLAISCAVDDGLLEADPGQPWRADPAYQPTEPRDGASDGISRLGELLPQKDDPAAERERVERLREISERVRDAADRGLDRLQLSQLEQADAEAHAEQCPGCLFCDNDQPLRVDVARFLGTPPPHPVESLVVGGLAADLCPGESDFLSMPLPAPPQPFPAPPSSSERGPSLVELLEDAQCWRAHVPDGRAPGWHCTRPPHPAGEPCAMVPPALREDGTCPIHEQKFCLACRELRL